MSRSLRWNLVLDDEDDDEDDDDDDDENEDCDNNDGDGQLGTLGVALIDLAACLSEEGFDALLDLVVIRLQDMQCCHD
eukprot:9482380-Pyramimonas_sp.AAC.1